MAINTKAPFTSAVVLTFTILNAVDTSKCLDGFHFVWSWSDAAELAVKPNSPTCYPFERTPAPVFTTAAADISNRGQVPWPVNSEQLIPWRLPK